jgi:hypothetical protein
MLFVTFNNIPNRICDDTGMQNKTGRVNKLENPGFRKLHPGYVLILMFTKLFKPKPEMTLEKLPLNR